MAFCLHSARHYITQSSVRLAHLNPGFYILSQSRCVVGMLVVRERLNCSPLFHPHFLIASITLPYTTGSQLNITQTQLHCEFINASRYSCAATAIPSLAFKSCLCKMFYELQLFSFYKLCIHHNFIERKYSLPNYRYPGMGSVCFSVRHTSIECCFCCNILIYCPLNCKSKFLPFSVYSKTTCQRIP